MDLIDHSWWSLEIEEMTVNTADKLLKFKGKNKMTRIYKDKDNNLVPSYKGIEDSDYENLTHYELIAFIEKLDFWDDIDIEVYESVLADVGLDYDDYDDPDVMWEDYLARVKLQIKEGEENEKRK